MSDYKEIFDKHHDTEVLIKKNAATATFLVTRKFFKEWINGNVFKVSKKQRKQLKKMIISRVFEKSENEIVKDAIKKAREVGEVAKSKHQSK